MVYHVESPFQVHRPLTKNHEGALSTHDTELAHTLTTSCHVKDKEFSILTPPYLSFQWCKSSEIWTQSGIHKDNTGTQAWNENSKYKWVTPAPK